MYRRVMHYLFYGVRTSLYTIFFVNISFVGFFFPFPFPFPFSLLTSFSAAGMARILMFDLAVALDSATYNWPCENTGSGKYTPTLGIVCPCDLLTVTPLSGFHDCLAGFLVALKQLLPNLELPMCFFLETQSTYACKHPHGYFLFACQYA